MGLLESGSGRYGILTVVFASLFLVSLGVFSYDAFAMGPPPGSCNNEYDAYITNATIIVRNQTYHPQTENVSFQMTIGQSYYLSYNIRVANQSNQGNTQPGSYWFYSNAVGYPSSSCSGTVYPNQNFSGGGYLGHPQDYSPYQSQNIPVSFGSTTGFSYNVYWVPPPSPPSSPQSLQATVGNSQILLSWAAPGYNGGSSIAGYNVYRATASGGEGSTPIATGINSTSYNDTKVIRGQTYFYTVTAVNSNGESRPSNEASTIIPIIVINNVQSTSGITSPSNQITLPGFDAGAGNDRLLVVGAGSNNASVASVTFGGVQLKKAVSSFHNNYAGLWYLANPSGSGDIVVTMDRHTNDIVGAYALSGVNQTSPIANHTSSYDSIADSPAISITTKYPNDEVLDLPSVYGSTMLSDPSCAQGWDVFINDAVTSASSSEMVPLPAATTCSWFEDGNDELWDDVAVDLRADSSDSTTYVTAAAPQPPTALIATGGNAQVSLSWSAPSGNGGSSITSYNIYRGTSSGSETLLATAGNVTSYVDNTVTNGQQYFYKVAAVNSIGESPKSNEASATPTAPTSTLGDKIIATISLGNQIPSSIDINSNTGKIYVGSWVHSFSTPSCYGSNNNVVVINGTSNIILGNITVGYSPAGVGVNHKTNMVYVADSGLSVINGTTDAVVSVIPVASPMGVGTNPVTNMIYVSGYGGEVDMINGTTNTVASTVSVGGHPRIVQVNPSTDKIYVADDSGIQVIDGSTDTIQSTISVGNDLSGIAVNPSTNKIYVTVGNSVSVIDGTTNTVVGTIPVGHSPGGIGVNPVTNMIYVANNGDNSVSIISGATNQVINTLSVGSQPAAVAVNPNTNTIYVANGGTAYCPPQPSSVSVIQGSLSSTSTVPSAPQNLGATAASSSQINLSWITPSSNGGSQVTGYMIQRSTNSGTTWSTIASNTGSAATKYNDTGLSPSTTYTYQVSAINSVGTSPPSNTASATTSGVTITSGIVLNNVQSTSGTTSSSNQIILSGFSAGTGSNQLLLVGISTNNNSPVSVTFNGAQLTQAVMSFYNNDAEFWYLKNPTGTGDITVTMGGSTQAVVGAYSFSGVNQTAPIATHVAKHNTTPNSPNISITTKYANDWVLDLPSIYGGPTLGSPICTQEWNVNVPNAITGASSSTTVQSPATITCKWTASSADFWDDVAIELRAAG